VSTRGPLETRISLVIPAHNESGYLPRLLDTVDVACRRYRFGCEAIERIVADNASTDDTARIARDRGCRVVPVAERKIARARNAGAGVARGTLLTFADADLQVHPETFNSIDAEMASGRVVGGATGVRLERMSLGIAATYALLIPWVILLRMDTGVVFCRRDDFRRIQGYDERRFFGEDVQLLVDLRRLGRPDDRHLTRLPDVKAVSSTRKFDRYGDWHYFTMLFRLLPMMLRHPSAANDTVRSYWYGD
jgi:glycosyltransferase involved in cell wall biosynthesis